MSALKWLATSLIVVFFFATQAIAAQGNTWTTREECVQVVKEARAGGYLPHVEYRPAYTGLRAKMDLSLEKRPLGELGCVRLLVAGGENRWVYQSPEREFRWKDGRPVFLDECGNPVTGFHRIVFQEPSVVYEASEQQVQAEQPEDDFLARRRARFEGRDNTPQRDTIATLGNLQAIAPNGGVAIAQGNRGMSTGGKILTGVAIVGGAYVLDRALDRASKPRTVVNNNGTCAGATFSVSGNNNATCGSTVVVGTPTTQPSGCNAPNRVINCGCPDGQNDVNGFCTVVQNCPDGTTRPIGSCPPVYTPPQGYVPGYTPPNGYIPGGGNTPGYTPPNGYIPGNNGSGDPGYTPPGDTNTPGYTPPAGYAPPGGYQCGTPPC